MQKIPYFKLDNSGIQDFKLILCGRIVIVLFLEMNKRIDFYYNLAKILPGWTYSIDIQKVEL